MEQCDIVYIHGCPTVSAIYYHTQLHQTHCLYCPHSIQVTVRELGKNLLHILDSVSGQETKKLAVHFPAPLAATQTRDIIKFLRSRRSTIRVGLLVLPVTPYQKQLWLGWAASFAESTNGDASLELWADRCLNNNQFAPKDIDKELFDHFEISPPKMRLDTAICISNQPFEKTALIVHISKQLASFTIENGLKFDPMVPRLIEAYTHCVKFPRIILVGNEKAIFGMIPNYSSLSLKKKQDTIKRYRQATKPGIQSLAGAAPIYICCTPYDGMEENPTDEVYNLIAWLQHRHHLVLSKCLLAQWAIGDAPKGRSYNLRQLLSFSLRDRSFFTLNKWRTEIESLLAKVKGSPSQDQITYISPHRLTIPSELPDSNKPLVKGASKELTNFEQQGNMVSHGICCNNHQVWDEWVNGVEIIVQDTVMTNINEPSNIENKTHNDNGNGNVLSRTAGRLTNESIQHYIGNPNSFKKGKDLLPTLSNLAVKFEDETAFLTGKAKGTSEAPYNLRILLGTGSHETGKYYSSSNGVKLFSHGFCSCYVGKEGRCKHIVALLLKFKEGAEDFDQSQSTLPLDVSSDKQESIEQPGVSSGDNTATAEYTVVADAKPAESSDNPILLPPTPRKSKGRRKIPTQWSEPAPSKGAKKRKRVEPAADVIAPEIQEAVISVTNDQQPSDCISATAPAVVEKPKVAKAKAPARNPTANRTSVFDSDSDIDDHDQHSHTPGPSKPLSTRFSRSNITKNNSQSEPSSAVLQQFMDKDLLNLTPQKNDTPTQNSSTSQPLTRAAKRLASFTDDDGPIEENSSQKSSAAQTKHEIDMQKSHLRTSDQTQQGIRGLQAQEEPAFDGARKKKKLDKMLDDLFSL
ncbi:hypothetical protein INT43_007508 [Umbelopsis isabellina]|uniref:SWIM-type domain-containing protein n=1 Tax=Mortierella isabellina TaxID=91625 RepID=A0A8H7PY84_MORIS|nr:hypothetical protein INT43_007508 [Umbelopsis isabellina]